MRRTYKYTHWALTLLIAPFTLQLIEYFFGKEPHEVVGLTEVYPIALLFSIAFSFPTFLIYLICFSFLSKQDINFWVSKLILITVSVVGIFITQAIIKGSMSKDIIIAYSVSTIIIGLVLRIKETKIKPQDNRIET